MQRRRKGLTLPEVMMVLVVLSILMALGVTDYRHYQAMRQVDAAWRETMTLLVLARESAQSQGGTTVVFTAGAAYTCTVSDTSGRTVKRYQAAPSVTLACPNGVLKYTYAANGAVSAGGTFTVASNAVNQTHTFTLSTLTGTVSPQ